MAGWKLAEHQLYAITMMDSNPSLAIFYEAGTGKTAIALAWAYGALQRGEITNVLVVCPASMVQTWIDAVDKMLNFEGFTEEGVAALRNAVHVSSFQKLYRTEKRMVHHRDGTSDEKRTIRLRPEVDRMWGAIIVDESHCIGNHSSVQTKSCLTLSRLARNRYIMSGTPVSGGKGKEDFQKLYGQMKFLDPGIWRTWDEFCKRYIRSYDKWDKPLEYDIQACREIMKDRGIVCRLDDCFDMPETTETKVRCELAERKIYRDIASGRLGDYGISVANAGGQYLKLLQLCSGSMKGSDGGILSFRTSKDSALLDILEGTDDKVVIFCQYTASVDHVAKLCADRCPGRRTVVFDGRSVTETWREFQYGDAGILVAQYQAGGTGLDLFSSATMVMWEPTMSALLLTQTKARIYRKGQTRHCTYYYLCTTGTIEEKVINKVMAGEQVTTSMLEAWAADEAR